LGHEQHRVVDAAVSGVSQGGHFAAMEVPELLVEDVRAFFRPLRS
jgi:hypothetical protein